MKKQLLLLLVPVLIWSCATVKNERADSNAKEIVTLMNQSSQD